MAIILDATLGGNQSNSYITMANAVGIAQNIPGGGDWAALDEEIRNLSLIQATRWLETLDYNVATAANRANASNGLALERNATE